MGTERLKGIAPAGGRIDARLLERPCQSPWRWHFREAGGQGGGGLVVGLWPEGVKAWVERQAAPCAPVLSVELESVSLKIAMGCRLPVDIGWVFMASSNA